MSSAIALVLPLVLPAAPQDERLDAERMVDEAWRFLPAYDGEHRYYLRPEVKGETAAGAHLLEAALALKPDHVRALWSLGHANILLGEDAKNRGLAEDARAHYVRATEALTQAIELQPTDPWALYARGTAHTNFGFNELALTDLTHSIENATAQIESSGESTSVGWLRFKAMEWRAEVLMRSGKGESAREELRAFHADFSTNEWPLYIALAESHERERDFASARSAYEEIIKQFSSDHQAYALLGYLEGLVGKREEATRRLQQALEFELEPGMYTRMWLWILATDEHRAEAEADFRGFMSNPPSSLSDWDRLLGAFVLGEGTQEEFQKAANAEVERRMAAGEPVDDLPCEAFFYLGLRFEDEAVRTEDEEARAHLIDEARNFYYGALTFDPVKWKWEWAFSRLRFAELTASKEFDVEAGLGTVGSSYTHGDVSGTLDAARGHVPYAESSVSALDRAPRPGDLLLGIVRADDGRRVPVRVVVGLR